jgi:hypothetical protein
MTNLDSSFKFVKMMNTFVNMTSLRTHLEDDETLFVILTK